MKTINRMALAYLSAVLLTASLPAQERFSTLTGTVKDASDAVVPGVKVTVENLATKRIFETQSGADGKYIALNLEPGNYAVAFARAGFGGKKVDLVNLFVGKTANVDVTLQVGNTT